MLVRELDQTDGICFASIASNTGCRILSVRSPECGTYACPFYKPRDKSAWIRVDKGNAASLFAPAEYIKKFS